MGSNKVYLGVILILIVVIVYLIAIKPKIQPTGITLEQMRDSLQVHDKVRNEQITELRVRYIQDSIRIAGIRSELQELPGKIEKIKNYYNEKRNHINTLPVDSQISYLSDWLSKEDSNR